MVLAALGQGEGNLAPSLDGRRHYPCGVPRGTASLNRSTGMATEESHNP